MKAKARLTPQAIEHFWVGQPVATSPRFFLRRPGELLRSRWARRQLWLRLTLRKEVTKVTEVDHERGEITLETVTKWVWQ